MGQRQTKKAGIQKLRLSDPNLQRVIDALIERLEVLDGIRGDSLDRAVTYRELRDGSGFGIGTGAGGNSYVVTTPGPAPGDGLGVGPAAAPENLVATETFLAILLTWDNPSFNLQHIEVWRGVTDNLSLAVLVGTTVSPQFVDYVGADAAYYYWVRAVGTDGSYSAYNDTAGTLGETGVDPSDFEPNLSISTANLDAALAARIDLVDFPGTGLVDRTTDLEGDVLTAEADITTLQSDVSGLTTTVGGHTTSINANASSISTNSTSITTLQSDVSQNQTDISNQASQIAVNANDILTLTATIGAIDAGGGQTWEFLSDLDGFTVANATLTGPSSGVVTFTPAASNPQLVSETVSLSGGVYTQVVVRLRQTIGGGTWEGTCFYQTSGHGFSASFEKTIPDPNLSLSEWTVLTWDMSDLTTGGSDWVNNTIEAIRLDFLSDAAGKFEIDYVLIAKFSTTAITEAIDALDVRVTTNESSITAQGTSITSLESTVDDPSTGVAANASAVSALTTDVSQAQTDISANSSAVTALQTTVNDGATGVLANASNISTLQTDVSNNQGTITSQAQSIVQLVASVDGGFGSLVNTLRTDDEAYGTDWSDSDVSSYSIGGRTGFAAQTVTDANLIRNMRRGSSNGRIFIEPNAVYEVRVSVYHNRPTNAGTFVLGMFGYAAATGGSPNNVDVINDGAQTSTAAAPVWVEADNVGENTWFDIVGYILGEDVAASRCPDLQVNGDDTNSQGFTTFNDGFRVSAISPFVEITTQNLSASPFGDDTSTTLYVTDVSVTRIDTQASLHSAISQETTVRASEVGDLEALYAVKVELATNNDPYITGFELAADVIDGVASSSFGIRADQFFITSPSFGSNPTDPANSNFPFIVDLLNGVTTVAIDGTLLVDGSIRANSINANEIGADKLNVNELSAISGDMGTLTAGLIRTAANPAFRVELEDSASTAYPIWYGSGSKSAPNGRFYVDTSGNVVVKGLLDAGMIKQSFFTPAGANNSFRIACDYPSNYSSGIYTGNAWHGVLRPYELQHVNKPVAAPYRLRWRLVNFNKPDEHQ